MKHLQHTSETFETDTCNIAFKCNIYLLFGRKWRLVDMELDTGVEFDATE
jgi:hypothetical protein